MLEIIFDKNVELIFFILSNIGHCIFLIGLLFIDRRSKSILSAYYGMLILISIGIYISNILFHSNVLVALSLSLLFLSVLFLYLSAFSRLSGQAMFIRSFYVLLICIFAGLVMLKFSNVIENRAIISFIIGFMIFPSLIMYISAIFSLQETTLNNLNRFIK